MAVTKLKSISKQIAGKKAKNHGDLFEKMFHAACYRIGIQITRIPDGCKQIGARRIIRVKTPFDYLLTYTSNDGRVNPAAMLDTKTTAGKAFSYSQIDQNQTKELFKHEANGHTCGYVVWLRDSDHIILIPAYLLDRALKSGAPGSFKPGDEGVRIIGTSKHLDATRIFGHDYPQGESGAGSPVWTE